MDIRKIIIWLSVIVGCSAVFYYCVPLLRSPEQKINLVILETKKAIEQKDPLKAISYISYSHNDSEGNSRADLFLIGQHVIKAYGDIRITLQEVTIKLIDETHAEVHVRGTGQAVSRNEQQLVRSNDYDEIECQVRLCKEEEAWKIIAIEFVKPERFLQFLKTF